MADPQLVLILLIATRSSDGHATVQIGGAARETLGSEVSLLVEDRESEPADDAAVETAVRVRATAIATVRWGDVEHREAIVRMYVPDDGRWYDRKLSFRTTDAPAERERAVGYFLGTMVRASLRPQTRGASLGVGPPAIAPPPERAPRASIPPDPSRAFVALDIAAAGALGIGGSATGIGPSGRLHFFATEHLGIFVGAAARFGRIPHADAAARTLRGGAGVTWRTDIGRVSVMFALDAVLLHHWAERTEPSAARSRWISGMDLATTIGYRVSPTLEPYAGMGVEVAWGATPVTVAGEQLAEIPPVRATAELGIRIRF